MNFQQIVWIAVAISVLISIFGVRYLKHRENMFLIRRNQYLKQEPNLSGYFSGGLILLGTCIGVTVGLILRQYINAEIIPSALLYILCVAFFCGIALLITYYYFKSLK
ncbi:Uncharacterised protein [Sphingobacterium thalpophilum]|uniref:Uncharacterized protein n=1 Tax=Sphingobacterium thalpophilum TaxID=259 RepID=A0A4U9VQK1_9SPHI|nr:Uncharacterised protein [Sphingobacterium thalpophilum]